MSWQAWFTLAVVIVTVVALASERVSPPAAIMTAVTVLLLTGVINSASALSGFSNEAPFTIAALYVVAGAAQATGALQGATAKVLGSARRATRRPNPLEMARLLAPAAGVSAFIYNTPLVSTFAPRVAAWAQRSGRPVSWYLLPLNIAILLGGLLTAIGTTTNVVISGLLTASHRPRLALFEPTLAALPLAVVGVGFLALFGARLAGGRHAAAPKSSGDAREFTVEMLVRPDGAIAGATVDEAGLRDLEGVYLFAVEREGATLAPIAPDLRLAGGDRLVFAGNVSRILDLQAMPGLRSAEAAHFSVVDTTVDRRFHEAVVASGGSLVGRSLKEVDFRSTYGGAVVAIHRSGELVQGKLGAIPLKVGDVLLILASPDFSRRWRGSGDFALVAPIQGTSMSLRKRDTRIVEVVVVLFLLAAATQVLSVLEASLVAAIALLALRVISPRQAQESVNMTVLVVVCGSFGIGAAIGQSHLANHIASLLTSAFGGLGVRGILVGFLLTTVLITQVVTNNAAAVLMYPVGLALAAQNHLHERPFVMALLVGASSSFFTPIGYQTNTIVYGIGGYRWSDFFRVGLPIAVITTTLAAITIPIFFALH
jgi:di/tricarboxylate transporter